MVAIGLGFAIFLVETRIGSRAVRVRSELLQHSVDEAATDWTADRPLLRLFPQRGISVMRSIVLVALLFAAPVAAAPHAKAHHAAPKSSTAKSKIQDQMPDFQAVAAMMDKFFPAQPDPEPARLALARTSAAALWPDGAYGRMFDGFVNQFADRALQIKVADFAEP